MFTIFVCGQSCVLIYRLSTDFEKIVDLEKGFRRTLMTGMKAFDVLYKVHTFCQLVFGEIYEKPPLS